MAFRVGFMSGPCQEGPSSQGQKCESNLNLRAMQCLSATEVQECSYLIFWAAALAASAMPS